MKIHHVAAHALGTIVVYVAVACSSSAPPLAEGAHEDAGLGDAIVDGALDALGLDTSPVKDARADDATAPGAAVFAAACDRDFPAGHPLAGSAKWGQKTFPGRSKEDLARAHFVLCYPTTPSTSPPGFPCYAEPPYPIDGALAFTCPTGTTGSLVVPPSL
jgi:hypothetical protein